MKLVIIKKKSYIGPMTVSIRTLQKSSFLLGHNKSRRGRDKVRAEEIKRKIALYVPIFTHKVHARPRISKSFSKRSDCTRDSNLVGLKCNLLVIFLPKYVFLDNTGSNKTLASQAAAKEFHPE